MSDNKTDMYDSRNTEQEEKNLPETDNEKKELKYVKERIIEKPHRIRKLIKKLIITVPVAIVFGVVACIVFVFLRPVLEPEGSKKEPETTTDTNIKNDVTEPSTEIETDKIFTTDDLKKMYAQLSSITEDMKKAFVIIDAYDGKKELFEEQDVEIISSGVIVSVANGIHILTMYKNVKDMESIEVTFNDGTNARAQLWDYDEITGMAILNMDSSELSDDTMKSIAMAKITEKNDIPGTEPVIYIGNPFGVNTYESIGFVSNKEIYTTGLDIAYRIIMTDIFISECNNGFIFNLDGELAGIVYDGKQVVEAMSAVDVKYIIDRINRKEGVTYMGISGEKITDEIRNIAGIDMPDGVYVTKVERDSPAYVAGIRKGDIIVQMNDISVKDMFALKTCLQNSSSSNKLNVDVERQNNDSFDRYTLEVVLSER